MLRENLDQPIKLFCGDMIGSSNTKDFWKEQTKENMIIVCTAAVLQHCLHSAFVSMERINLLIFDEAHHTKKKHPYAQIIKDFYTPLKYTGKRQPRIFGMTASPVDAKTNIHKATAELESLLNSEIATIADSDAFEASSIHQPDEHSVLYPRLRDAFETPLWRILRQNIGDNSQFEKLFIFSKNATRELGLWCANRVWALSLTADEKTKIVARTGQRLLAANSQEAVEAVDESVSAIEEAYKHIVGHSCEPPKNDRSLLSSKVVALSEAFDTYFDPTKDKCIVFVEQRLTAMLLADLFDPRNLEKPGLKAGFLVGTYCDQP